MNDCCPQCGFCSGEGVTTCKNCGYSGPEQVITVYLESPNDINNEVWEFDVMARTYRAAVAMAKEMALLAHSDWSWQEVR